MSPETTGSPLVRRDLLAPAMLVFLLVWGGAALMRPGFWVLDEAIRYMQGTSLLDSVRLPPPILLPEGPAGEAPDPGLAPLPFHYGRVAEGRVYAQYSPALALVSLPFRSLLGHAGAFAVPALGASACWLLLASALLARGFPRLQALLLPVAGAPLLFYGMTFWSHTTAIALVLAAVILTLDRGRCLLPMLLVAAAALFREEALPFLAFPLLLAKTGLPRKLIGAAATGLLLIAVSRLMTGSWLGTHLQASGAEQVLYGHAGMGWTASRLFVLHRAVLAFFPGAPVAADVAASLLLGGLWILAVFGRGASARVASVAGPLLAAAALAAAASRGFRLLDTLFFLKHPLLVFPGLWLVRPRGIHALLTSGILLLLLLLMEPMHAEDLAWGSRLILLPLAVLLLSAVPGSRSRTTATVVLGLLACSVSVTFLARKRALSEDLIQLAERGGGAVIVTDWLLAGEFAGPMERGVPVVFAPRSAAFAEAASVLRELHPVAVSDWRDLEGQMPVFRGSGFLPTIAGVVEFDPALRVAVVTLSGTGEP